jgi:phage terminase large subunit
LSVLRIEAPEIFQPLTQRMRFKGAYGGRGGGKSHFFASYMVGRALTEPGLRAVCIREVQRSLAQSVKQLLEDKINATGAAEQFDVLESEIRTPGSGLIVFNGMQNHTAHSIKSLEGFDIAWVEEAQSLSARSLNLLRPTIRKDGSEIWFSWNPENEHDPVDRFLRGHNRPPNSIVIKANYLDNPWVSNELLGEAELDKADPDKYDHVWLGGYAKVVEGAYYAAELRRADDDGRITPLALDPILGIHAAWDLGVADATAIWVSQWVGTQIRMLDYIEGQGQPLGYYLDALRRRGYERAECILPHDGVHRDQITATRYEDHIQAAGFATRVIRNQGKGAAMQRIEAARRWFPRMWFDAEKTLAGRKALAAYHEHIDEDRQIGLGPEHDWASHGADAFGLMALAYIEPSTSLAPVRKRDMSWVV